MLFAQPRLPDAAVRRSDVGHYILGYGDHQLDARLLVDAQDDQGEDLDGPARGRQSDDAGRRRAAACIAVIAIGLGARALFGGRRDEVIERLERGDRRRDGCHRRRQRAARPRGRSRALASSCVRFARLVKPAAGEELSRMQPVAGARGLPHRERASRSSWASSCCCRLVIDHHPVADRLAPGDAARAAARDRDRLHRHRARVLPAQHVAAQQDQAAAAVDRARRCPTPWTCW